MKARWIFLNFAFLLFFALHPFGAQSAEPVIREVAIKGEDQQHAEQLKRIIPLREGDELSVANIARTVSLLKKTGFYKVIQIEEEQVPDGVRVVITLEPNRFVRKIRFKGAFPIFETELQKIITVKEGAVYDPDKIAEDINRLEAFLKQQGYFDGRVEVDLKPDIKTGDVILTFRLKKGLTYRLRKVTADGNKNLPVETIKLIIRRHMFFQFNKEKLEKGISAILKNYNLKGFYEAEVKIGDIDLEPDFHTVAVHLHIKEGPRANVVILGNRHAGNARLLRETTLADQKSIDEYEIAESANKMAEFYRQHGYRNVRIEYEINKTVDEKNNPLTEITYRVNEGPKVRVKKVKFRGAQSFDQKKLRKQMITGRRRAWGRASLLVDSTLSDDLAAVRTFYNNWGFEEAGVGTPEIKLRNRKGSKVIVIIPVKEGPQAKVRDVKFEGMEFFETEYALNKLKLVPGTPFDSAILEADKRRLLILYADYGFPYAKISQKIERAGPGSGAGDAVIKYSIQEGARVTVGETLIRGNYETKGRVLTREVEIQSGEPFGYSGLLASRRNLRSLPFLYTARLDTLGLEENMDIVHLLLEVRERPVRTVDLGFGYDSDLGPNLWLEMSDLNLFGLGKTGRLKLMGGGDITMASALYSDPRFMGSRIRADASMAYSYEIHETFNLTQTAGKVSLTKKLTPHLTGTLGARTSWNRLSDIRGEISPDITTQENTLIGWGPLLVYDTRDDFIDPSKGWFNRISVEYVEELIHANRFVKTEGQASHFDAITPRVVLATSLTLGHIEPVGDSRVPLQEVFFVGGNRSVRGWSEDGLGPRGHGGTPLGGLDKIVTSVELRFPIYRFIHGVVFSDSGQLVASPDELKLDNQLFSVGAGIRLMTPVGPVRLDWGYKLEPSEFENRWRIHFSFGYPF